MGNSTDTRQLSSAQQSNLCARCTQPWSACVCRADERTESIHSLLDNALCFPDIHSRHLCVFLYHCYQRWTKSAEDDDFSAGCLPQWEGWYVAWLKPSNNDTILRPRCDDLVLPCTVQYCNGSSAEGFIDSQGHLIVELPGPRPPGARDYDLDRHIVVHRVAVTQSLTLHEIERNTRGFVHNRVKVSHIVDENENGDRVQVSKLPHTAAEARDTVVIATQRVNAYSPHLYEEMRWRRRMRFTKKAGATVQRFLFHLFQKAKEADHAARYALQRSWRQAREGPNAQLAVLGRQLEGMASIPSVITESIESRAEDSHGQADVSRDRKRARMT